MRFVVAQMGARRGYAVPMILEKAGMLERFYTDLAGNVGLGRWLVKCGPMLGSRKLAARLAGRRIPNLIQAKTVTFGCHAFRSAGSRALRPKEPVAGFREQLRGSQALGRAIAQRGFGEASHLYSMLGECGSLMSVAKRRRLTTVTEFYILLSAERILKKEQCAFAQWENIPPNFNTIRAEFPGEENLLTETDFAVCPSEAVRHDLEEEFGFRRGRSALVPYGVDAKWLALEAHPVPGRLLFVGTAGLRKGIHYLAMAAERLQTKGRCYEFRVAGDVTGQVTNQPACRHLNFLGRIPRSRIQEEYSLADVFVLPSLAEGSAEVTYEALGAGLPVIATAAAGSVARDGIEGCIVGERDSTTLAAAIERVVENRQLRTQLSVGARTRAGDYTLERYGERLLAALRSFKP